MADLATDEGESLLTISCGTTRVDATFFQFLANLEMLSFSADPDMSEMPLTLQGAMNPLMDIMDQPEV